MIPEQQHKSYNSARPKVDPYSISGTSLVIRNRPGIPQYRES